KLRVDCEYEPKKDPDRQLAEWVLSQGGTIHFARNTTGIAKLPELPPGPIVLAEIGLGKYRLADADVVRFRGVDNLETCWLNPSNLRDKGLKELANTLSSDRIRQLSINSGQTTDAGMADVARFTALRILQLSGSKVTGEGLKHLAKLGDLAELNLSGTP